MDIQSWLGWGGQDLRDSSSSGGKIGAAQASDPLGQILSSWNSSGGVDVRSRGGEKQSCSLCLQDLQDGAQDGSSCDCSRVWLI